MLVTLFPLNLNNIKRIFRREIANFPLRNCEFSPEKLRIFNVTLFFIFKVPGRQGCKQQLCVPAGEGGHGLPHPQAQAL